MKLIAGVDIGSVTTKCVVILGEEAVGRALVNTGTDTGASAAAVFAGALEAAHARDEEIAAVVSTGYGRRMFKRADRNLTEISAAGLGGWTLAGRKPCCIIDVGGQDTKVIEVGADGGVLDFLMNDKCAAGTGRFLDLMSQVLGTDLPGLSALAEQAARSVTINATCSVFAESEVVSLIAHGVPKEEIAAGLFRAIAGRIGAMVKQFRGCAETVFCGGGARLPFLKRTLEETAGFPCVVLPEPQFVVAYGAALSAAGKGGA